MSLSSFPLLGGNLSAAWQLVWIACQHKRYKILALILAAMLWEVTDCCIKSSRSQQYKETEVCCLFTASQNTCDTLSALFSLHNKTQIWFLYFLIYPVFSDNASYISSDKSSCSLFSLRPLISLGYCNWLTYCTVSLQILFCSKLEMSCSLWTFHNHEPYTIHFG